MTEVEAETWEDNLYYSPEKLGFTLVASLEDDEPYQYDTVIVVRQDASGKLFAAHDSGCSCPTPFEEVRSLDKLTPIRSVADVQAFVKAHGGDERYKGWTAENVMAFYGKVQEALRG